MFLFLREEEDDEFSLTFKLTLSNALILSKAIMFTDFLLVQSGLCMDVEDSNSGFD